MFARRPVNGCLYANVANECTLITTKTTTRGNKQTKHREQKKGVSGYYRNQCWFAFVLWVLFTVFSFFLNASFGYINQKRMWPGARYWCTRLRISTWVSSPLLNVAFSWNEIFVFSGGQICIHKKNLLVIWLIKWKRKNWLHADEFWSKIGTSHRLLYDQSLIC